MNTYEIKDQDGKVIAVIVTKQAIKPGSATITLTNGTGQPSAG